MSSLYAVGSGLDIPTLVSQLVAADRTPIQNRINTQGTKATAQLSALGTIKSAMSNLQSSLNTLSTAITTPSFKTTVATDAGFTASSTASAAAGSYDIKVDTLAAANKLTTKLAFTSTELVGEGSLQLAYGDTTLDIDVAADMTLSSLAREINRKADGKGITASVITSDAGQHLVLTSLKTGNDGAISMTGTGTGRLSELNWDASTWDANNPDAHASIKNVVPATNAKVFIDGQERTGSSNTFTDLIEGVTINLTKADADKAFNLSIAGDNSTAKTSLQAFVSVYNATLSALKSVSNYNADTKTASALTGDSMVRGLQNQLRSIMGNNNVSDMKALGVSVAKDGVLSFNTADFDKAMAEQPNLAARVLGKEGSITKSMTGLLDANLATGTGLLTQRTDSLNKQIKKLEKDLDDLDVRMDKVYERYTKQFTSMDSLVASMQNTSNYLTSQLANLPSASKSK